MISDKLRLFVGIVSPFSMHHQDQLPSRSRFSLNLINSSIYNLTIYIKVMSYLSDTQSFELQLKNILTHVFTHGFLNRHVSPSLKETAHIYEGFYHR